MGNTGVVVTGSGNLKCKKVISVAGPRQSAGRQDWKLVVDNILTAAVRTGMRSVSIPALGTGKYMHAQYSLDITDS